MVKPSKAYNFSSPAQGETDKLFSTVNYHDHSIIVLKLEQADSKPVTKKLSSKCIVCGKTMDNDNNSIMSHLKSQRHQLAESVQDEAQVMGENLAFGGIAHRKATVDSYMLAYFCMREKTAFTLPARMKETMAHLHCWDLEAVANMHLSRDTIALSEG